MCGEEEEALQRLLQLHPSLRLLPPGKKVRCSLTGHELPSRLSDLQAYTGGKKYLRLSRAPGLLHHGQHQPHIVPSTKNPHQLFCKLTLRHINKVPEHVLRHVQGRRYQKALKRYEECQKEGVEYVPACLQKRQRRQQQETPAEGDRKPRRKGVFWEPPSSDEGGADTDDSMSDLYPAKLFPGKSPAAKGGGEELAPESDKEAAAPVMENGGSHSEGREAMEVDAQKGTKRGKNQGGSLKKKFKSRHIEPKRFCKGANGREGARPGRAGGSLELP